MPTVRTFLAGSALVATAFVAGALGAGVIGAASAQTTSTTPPAASSGSTPAPAATPAQPNRPAETPLTGSDADKAKAAALAAVPGATVDRVETDADGAAYEAHVTKADGTKATVKMDSSFKVTGVETDNGGGRGGHGGGPHQANGKTETVLTGSDADKATAAAKDAVPGATVNRVETDADGATYEAHVTKPDGSQATVKMDGSFKVTSVEDGMR